MIIVIAKIVNHLICKLTRKYKTIKCNDIRPKSNKAKKVMIQDQQMQQYRAKKKQ